MRNARPRLVLVAIALMLSLTACAPSEGPGGLPGDLPIPSSRVTQDPWPAPVGFKQVTLEMAALSVVDVPRWYEKELKGSKWRDARGGPTLFEKTSSGTASTFEATFTDGSKQVKVTATDTGPKGLQTLVIFQWAEK